MPPQSPTVIDDKGKEIQGVAGPYEEGDEMKLVCIVTGGKSSHVEVPKALVKVLTGRLKCIMEQENRNKGTVGQSEKTIEGQNNDIPDNLCSLGGCAWLVNFSRCPHEC